MPFDVFDRPLQNCRRFLRATPALFISAWLAIISPSFAAEDYSPSERALFMSRHLQGLKPPLQLSYSYQRSGTLEPAFKDTVKLRLQPAPDGSCCAATAEFLSGERRLSLPDVEAAEANPVILYFLERDIREMNRLTKGQAAYFRKRIRMAVYQGAKLTEVTVSYKGKPVAAQRITITPYVDDPLRVRFEKLAGKAYTFTLSHQVPGTVYAIHATVMGADMAAAPLLVEELLVEGGTPGQSNTP